LEYRLVCEEAEFHSNDRILDVGSPKLLSLYVAQKVGAEIFATDIEDYFLQEYDFLKRLQNVHSEKFHTRVEDGRNLSFADDYFNKIYSISVLEHIPDDGDTQCVKEIRRVLAKGGRCVITVPFAPKFRMEYRKNNFYWARSSTKLSDGSVFYQRRYSEADLYKRLIDPSGLTLKKLKYLGEKVMTNSKWELTDILSPVTGPIQPLLSKLFHTAPVDSWKDLKKPLCALIVLEK
jgi:cyclopropane fatty-acyl-phospholipid synthase-like methyltransferase